MFQLAYVLGTRPEVIRSARLLKLLSADDDWAVVVINTGQHYDDNMLGRFLLELEIPSVSIDLNVGPSNPAEQTASIIRDVANVIKDERPDGLCVFGDTNSTLGAAVAAVKVGVPLAHIEAGCRSFDMAMPEEVNRRAVDHISDLLLPVSELAAENLRREGAPGRIEVVGDPQYDVFIRQSIPAPPRRDRRQGLITLHRPENADESSRLERILEEISIASLEDEIDWVFPVHPRTAKALRRVPDGIRISEPLGYRELLSVLFNSRVCVTDSGGLQKEAFWARVPCVTVRKTSEWMETVWAGANTLAQPEQNLAAAVNAAATQQLPDEYDNPYGAGDASEQIVRALRTWLT
jgi:UDP-N-acetylglucosamine 2-epimerase